MKKLALLALICLSCGSSKQSVIVVSLSYDATVKNPDAIKILQVTVDGVVKNYPVPASAPFQDCTPTAPCTLEIDTERPGHLDISISGMGAVSDGGYSVLGTGSGSAMADPDKVQTVPIQLSCASGSCGIVTGTDGGAGAGGHGGSVSGGGGAGGGAGGSAGTAGAGGSVGGAGTTGGGGTTGRGGTTGVAGTGGMAGTAGTAGTSGAAGTAGTAGAAGRGGTTGTAGTSGSAGTTGAAGRGGTTGTAGTSGSAGTTGAAGRGGTTGAGGTGGAANCADAIKLSGYSWAGAPPCSACFDNQVSQAAKCESLINCVDQNYPCTGSCLTTCQNQVGANFVVLGCANALLSAACN